MALIATNRQAKTSKLTKDEADASIGMPNATQTSHGFAVGDVVRESAANTYTKAQADSEANIGVGLGFVFNVLNANNFSIVRARGRHVAFAAHGLLGGFGTKLYLSQSTAGLITATEPTSGLIQYVGYIWNANNIVWEPTTPYEI